MLKVKNRMSILKHTINNHEDKKNNISVHIEIRTSTNQRGPDQKEETKSENRKFLKTNICEENSE